MADYKTGFQEPESSPSFLDKPTKRRKRSNEAEDFLATFSGQLLERADTIIYAIVGISFLVGALFALGYSFWEFGSKMTDAIGGAKVTDIAPGIIQFISDLLLVLIIMEVLSTVLHYLKERATSLQPFLFIGIVSATRSILSIGARLSVEGNAVQGVPAEEFTRAMIELGVSAAVILALGITLKLLGRQAEIDSSGD